MAGLFRYILCSGLFVWFPFWTVGYESSLRTSVSLQKTTAEIILVKHNVETASESQGHATPLTSTLSESEGEKVKSGLSTVGGAEYLDSRSSDENTSSETRGAGEEFAYKTGGFERGTATLPSDNTPLSDNVLRFEPSPFWTAEQTQMTIWRDSPVCDRLDDYRSGGEEKNEPEEILPEKSVTSYGGEGESKHHVADTGEEENNSNQALSSDFHSNTKSEDDSSMKAMTLPDETDDIGMDISMLSTTSSPESVVTTVTTASNDFPCDIYVCDCSKKKKQALCCGRHYKLRHIPRVPAYVSTFRLWMASLEQLNREKLGNLSNFNIQTIDLQNNRIKFLANDTFADFQNLKTLDLGSNPIAAEMLRDSFYSIQSSKFDTLRLDSVFLYDFPDNFLDAFRNRSMKVITISNNSLHTFNARVFSPLRSLFSLYLSDNGISDFVLNNTVYVQRLNLERNVLTAPPLLCNPDGGPAFPNLFSLYLGGNPFKTMPAGVLRGRCLPKLLKLDISSANVLKTLGNNFIADLPRLENLMAGHMHALARYEPLCFNSSSLTTLFLMDNKVWTGGSIVPQEIFAHAPNLKEVDMTKTKFDLNPDVDLARILLPAQSLVSLSMGSCLLGSLPADTLWKMPNLRKLDLIGNHVTAFSLAAALRNVTQLHTLVLQANKITAVNETTFPLEFRQSIRVLDLSKNDFACTCDLLWFKSWIELERASGNVTFPNYPTYYRCRTPDNLRGVYLSQYNPSYRECHPLNIYIVVGSVAGVLVMATAVTLALTYRYRWYLRYYIYRLRRRRKYERVRNEDDEDEIVYDVYIAYSQFDVEWVMEELAPLLEGSPGVENVFIKDRDQGAGPLADNIVRFMDQSSRIVLVLSDGYTREGWSGYEFNNVIYAANEQHKDVIVILKGDVEAGRLTKDMRRLLTGGTFLHWEGAEEARGTFRDALRVALRTRGNMKGLV